MWKRTIVEFLLFSALAFCCVFACAQTSSTLFETSRAQQYQAIKNVMQQFDNRGLLANRAGESRELGEYDLENCGGADLTDGIDAAEEIPEIPPTESELDRLIDLAQVVVTWENDFRILGIPMEVWEPLVNKFEQNGLAHANNDQMEATRKRLRDALNSYRRQSKKPLPKFKIEGECGAGELEVHIALVPPEGQLFLIPVFLYKLCQAQHLNPADLKSCDRWTEVLKGTASYVSGDYIYLARWADGSVRCGPLGFKSFDQAGTKFIINKIKMRSPECGPGW